MQQSNRKKPILIMLITAMIFVLSAVAIATAWKLRQMATVPVAPNAPQSVPQAAENPPATPTPQLVCSASFEVSQSSCDGWCDENLDCESGMTCLIETGETIGVCRNPLCTSDVDCLCPGVSPSPTPTTVPGVSPSPTPTRVPGVSPSPTPTTIPGVSPSPSPTNAPGTTPTMGPTSALNPTPQPTNPPGTLVACNGSCSSDEDCSGTNVCQGGMCRNPSCTGETDCNCASAVVPTTPVLPQAGSDMPTIALLSMGTLILLAGLIGLLVL
jgi:hypothetical protein